MYNVHMGLTFEEREQLRTKAEGMILAGISRAEVVNFVTSQGMSRRGAYNWIDKMRHGLPNAIVKSREYEARLEIGYEAERETVEAAEEQGDSYAGKVMSIAKDMSAIRDKAMKGQDMPDGVPDYRLAILAATTESNLIANSAKLMRDMREASKDNVMLHPQMAKFKEDFFRWAEQTGNVESIIGLYESHQ